MTEPAEVNQTPPAEPVVEQANDVVEEPTILGAKAEGSPKEGDAEAKKEEPKEVKKDAEPKAVPEKYEVKLPEGLTLDVKTLDAFSPIFKELGITNEGAQKLVDAYVPLIQSVIDQNRKESLDTYKKIVDEWKAETMKELGANSKEELASVGKLMNKFGNDDLRKFFDDTGVGNNIHMVKLFAKIGKTISEDTLSDTNTPLSKLTGEDLAKKMYPTMQQ